MSEGDYYSDGDTPRVRLEKRLSNIESNIKNVLQIATKIEHLEDRMNELEKQQQYDKGVQAGRNKLSLGDLTKIVSAITVIVSGLLGLMLLLLEAS